MSVDLRFVLPLQTGHPVDLLFGQDTPAFDGALVSFSVTLAAPTAAITLSAAEKLDVASSLPLPMVSFALVYDNAAPRGLSAATGARWQEGAPARSYTTSPYDDAQRLRTNAQLPWVDGSPLESAAPSAWEDAAKLRLESRKPWQGASALGTRSRTTRWQTASRRQDVKQSVWQEGAHTAAVSASVWQERSRHARPLHGSRWMDGLRVAGDLRAPHGTGRVTYTSTEVPWEQGSRPKPGRSVINRPQPPVEPPCYEPDDGDAVALLFKDAWSPAPYLVFPCCKNDGPPPLVVVPVRKVYIVINDVYLKRVSGNLMLPCLSLELSIDVDSWTWSFSASLPASSLDDVMPSGSEPLELEAKINAGTYRLLAENIARERQFGQNGVRVSGRGKSALLASPYAAVQTFSNSTDRTAQQLMADVLTDNGVSIGWDVDWGLTDWLVPAGVFSHTGSYMDALANIATAAGGYIQPHPTAQQLLVRPRYAAAPWDWDSLSADIALPADVAVRESIEWRNKPQYNRVFVSGQSQGVLGQITRTGTAGDLLAPMVTDPLITHADAARQRGLGILADTGRQAMVSLSLPVLSETGIITPGKLIEYDDGGVTRVGLSRGVNVSVRSPVVRQTVLLETHL